MEPITQFYTACLALFFMLLSFRVIALRGNPMFRFMKFGYGGELALERAVRAHGNFSEYTPLMLFMVFLLERGGAEAPLLHTVAGAFLLGRLMHGICFGFMERSLPLRIGGTALTLFPILGAAILLLRA